LADPVPLRERGEDRFVIATAEDLHLVARDEGYFRDHGLDVEIVKTPGTGQRGADHQALRDNIFKRTMESLYEEGKCDNFRMCEWGIMKRAVEAEKESLRGRKIVALGASMSKFAIVVDKDSDIYEPEMLKDKTNPVTPNKGPHFTTLQIAVSPLSSRTWRRR